MDDYLDFEVRYEDMEVKNSAGEVLDPAPTRVVFGDFSHYQQDIPLDGDQMVRFAEWLVRPRADTDTSITGITFHNGKATATAKPPKDWLLYILNGGERPEGGE